MSRYCATIVARINGRFLAVNVSAEYTPGELGKTSGAPEDCYEGEPESFEGFRATCGDGNAVELSHADMLAARAAIRRAAEDEVDYDKIF